MVAERSSGLGAPEELALDAGGDLHVNDAAARRMLVFGSDGSARVLADASSALGSPEAVAIGPRGDFLVAAAYTVFAVGDSARSR